MLFNSYQFIIFFITVLTLISIVKKRQFQHLLLLSASYLFFYFSSNYLIILLIFSTILDYYVGKEIFSSTSNRRKKFLLLTSLSANLGMLGFFKYVDFGISQFNELAKNLGFQEVSFLNLVLPIGISFYVFQSISYTIDVYRGNLKPCKSISEFALFVAFFPQLVAGPILRANQFLPQLREKIDQNNVISNLRLIILENNNLKLGVTIMSFGFLKKMFFADNIAPLVDEIFSVPFGNESFTVLLGAIAFGVQIYCDFSGYSDIAIGAAIIMGFTIPANFNKPYFAISPVDFWRRWHISLSSWLRDYLYITLGGNRKGHVRTCFNILAVMLLGGLWHGASWNFVIWGLLHGSFITIQKTLNTVFPNINNSSFLNSKGAKILAILGTQYLVFLAWLAFRVQNMDSLLYSMYKYVFWDFALDSTMQIVSHNKIPIALIIIFFIWHYASYKKNLHQFVTGFNLKSWTLFLTCVMILIIVLYDNNPHDFIYFRF